ncbi:MAG: S41 family peptidase [Streptosporangiaceae bacterium]
MQRVALLQEADLPQIRPEELLVRVFVGLPVDRQAAAGATDISHAAAPSREKSLQSWAAQHETAMRRLRRELSMRLPPARLLEFTIDDDGEDFCYPLQALGRAQLIGETTGDGAHPKGTRPLSPTMAISVPFARSVNPVTGTNWEGTGVVPDVSAAAAEAYDVAYGTTLRHVLSLDTPPPIREEATAALARLSA